MTKYSSGCREDRFGPSVQGCSRFDFTLLFEDTILSLLPSCCFLVVGLIRWRVLSSKSTCVASCYQRWLKLVSKHVTRMLYGQELTMLRVLCLYTALCKLQISSFWRWSRASVMDHLSQRSPYQRSAQFFCVSFRSWSIPETCDRRRSSFFICRLPPCSTPPKCELFGLCIRRLL